MAETDLNLSLDDIIKRNAENSKKRVSTAGGSRRGDRGGRGSRSSSDFQPKGLGVQSRVVKTIRGGRGQGRGGRDRAASRAESNYLRDPPRDPAAVHGAKAWTHDQFHQVQASGPKRATQQRLRDPADGTRLNISNLDRMVTDVDIMELFQECGRLKKYGVRFDEATGKANGTAFVQFEEPEGAQEALQKYNNVALDGKPMRIEFDEGSSDKVLSSGLRVGGQSNSGRLVQQGGRLFQSAAGQAQLGGRSVRPSGMRSTITNHRMEMD